MFFIGDDKSLLRAEFIAKRNSLKSDMRIFYSERAIDFLAVLDSYASADNFLFYSPISGELDVMPEFNRLLNSGHRCFLPKCRKSEPGVMDFFLIESTSDLVKGKFGIFEPSESSSSGSFNYINFAEKNNSVCIIPGILFDSNGYRLGYGKGYYDRFLRTFNGTTIGITYSDFLVERLPVDEFDIPCDIIVTEKGILSINENKNNR